MSLKTQIEDLSAQLADALAQVTAEQGKNIQLAEELASAVDARLTLQESLAKEIESLTEERDAHLAQTHEQAARIAVIEDDLRKANDELNQARQALANPAYVQAGAIGGDPVQDIDGAAGSAVSVLEQFESIQDPQARNDFYKANRAAIKAEIRKG